MFVDEPSVVQEIEHKIIAIFYPPGAAEPPYRFEHVMTALMNCVTFQMALACPACRKHIAQKIRQNLPAMLTTAGHLAASSPGEHNHTCH